MGHQVIFLIGDFTAQIGDPSGQDSTRPPLPPGEIKKNTQTYADQVFKILDSKKTQIVYNSKWINQMTSSQWVHLASLHTVARMLERDDFFRRYKNKKPIYIHEFLYPLVQGYDSVQVKADIEIGGSDQIFNLLMGRELQKHFNQKPQCVLTFPLLEGLDGQKKMSKSFGNFIALKDAPGQMYGKIMSISDPLMLRYFELLVEDENVDQLKKDLKNETKHPFKEKKRLAQILMKNFYSASEIKKAMEEFERVFSRGVLPENLKSMITTPRKNVWVCHLLKELGLIPSTAEGKRLIQSGGVRINSEKVSSVNLKLDLPIGAEWVVQVGKRKFLKLKVQDEKKD